MRSSVLRLTESGLVGAPVLVDRRGCRGVRCHDVPGPHFAYPATDHSRHHRRILLTPSSPSHLRTRREPKTLSEPARAVCRHGTGPSRRSWSSATCFDERHFFVGAAHPAVGICMVFAGLPAAIRSRNACASSRRITRLYRRTRLSPRRQGVGMRRSGYPVSALRHTLHGRDRSGQPHLVVPDAQ